MDLTVSGLDIVALVTAAGGVVKSLHSDRKASGVKKELSEEVAVLKKTVEENEKKLLAGEARFEKQDAKFDRIMDKVGDIDKNVSTILGYLKGKSEN